MLRLQTTTGLLGFVLAIGAARAAGPLPATGDLDQQFTQTVRPFLDAYCTNCHGGEKPKAELTFQIYSSLASVTKEYPIWARVRERLISKEMPPPGASSQPTNEQRQRVVDWVDAVRTSASSKHAGEPGIVIARRLSNSEFDYTIRDLTGVDLKPTREFPVDPANTAGFDNSGETLTISPSLLDKYLKAAHEVADHMFLKPDGFAFSPTLMLAETDRDQYCVQNIIALYHRQNIDYADYFQAAWRFKHRAALGKPQAALADFAADANVSAKYLSTVWSMLEIETADVGPLVKLQSLWNDLPEPPGNQPDLARDGCTQMRDYVVQFRKKVEPRFLNLAGGRGGNGQGGLGSPVLIWKNVQYATHRMTFDRGQLQVEGEPLPVPLDVSNEPNATGAFGPGRTVPVINAIGDPDLVVPAGQRDEFEAAFAKFCRVFPDRFYMEERGRNYFDTKRDRGRYLSAGFHSLMGYFRDDQPLYELILDDKQQNELDDLWVLFDFMASATERMYTQAGGSGGRGGRGGAAPATVPEAIGAMVAQEPSSEPMIKKAEAAFVAQAAGNEATAQAGRDYYEWINKTLRTIATMRLKAEPKHLDLLLRFAARAYRRPLTELEKSDLVQFYQDCRQTSGMDHESAMRQSIVAVLMSPDLNYRVDLMAPESGIHTLSDYELASRLSYFLWSSMPDEELLAHAAMGDLHNPKVIAAQASRMLKDQRVRGLALEFGGNWLDFRHFDGLTTVDRERFKSFDNDLRQAMFEEPIRFLMDVVQNNRSVMDCLYANDTFVNPVLARHYGMQELNIGKDEWVHIIDASPYERGGILPMAAFLTKNAPGLRTSPVKRGNWVVKNILGEQIPAPPPNVPALPPDESKLELPLRETLARHRADPNCATCHAKFDSFGLVFEGFGPIGERRTKDLADRPVETSAAFPDGSEGAGLSGLRKYIHERRENDFLDNLCGKLLAYALSRSLILSDDAMIHDMHEKLAADAYRFDSLIESIVASRQFLNKQGPDTVSER